MGMRTSCVAIFLTLGSIGVGFAAPLPCEEPTSYLQALCHYRQKVWVEAEAGFSGLVELGVENPETIRSLYFRARTRMQLKRWNEASADLIRIYRLDPPFFQEWNGDFLLGECRRMSGKD